MVLVHSDIPRFIGGKLPVEGNRGHGSVAVFDLERGPGRQPEGGRRDHIGFNGTEGGPRPETLNRLTVDPGRKMAWQVPKASAPGFASGALRGHEPPTSDNSHPRTRCQSKWGGDRFLPLGHR